MANYYDNISTNEYTTNISGLIQRINDAHGAIRSKARDLGLEIPANAKLTSNANNSSAVSLADNGTIMDTAAAINNMAVYSTDKLELTSGGSYTVPVGYNLKAFTVTAPTLAAVTAGATAEAGDILSGKTAYVNGSKITGTMPNHGEQAIEIPVTIKVGSTGENIVEGSMASFEAGYYSAINIKAVYDSTSTSDNKVINIDNAVGQLNAQSGNLTITDGYDYFAANAAYSVKTGSITDVTRSVNSATGVVTFGGGVITAGWISADVTKPATYTPVSAVFGSSDGTGKVKVTTAGWVTKDTEIGGLAAGKADMTGPILAESATTVGEVSIASGEYYMELVKTTGYITTGTVGINLGRVVINNSTSTDTATSTINTQKWQVVTSAGYNPSPITTVLTVKSGSVVLVYKDNIPTNKISVQEGWSPTQTITLEGTAQEYTVTGSEDSSSYVVEAAEGTFMKSLEINTSSIYARLAAI